MRSTGLFGGEVIASGIMARHRKDQEFCLRSSAVEVKVKNFVADGPIPCSKSEMDAKANTAEARRLEQVP